MKKSQSVWMCASTSWVYVQKHIRAMQLLAGPGTALNHYFTCIIFVHVETHISIYNII